MAIPSPSKARLVRCESAISFAHICDTCAINPIKFSVTADEALTKLLLPQNKGYLPAEKAVTEVFDDIRAHQLSVIAGMQTALDSILRRFSPQEFEKKLQKISPFSANIPVQKQAKLWALFEQHYEEIGRETQDNFYLLFGKSFAESYEKQNKQLRQNEDK